MTGTPKIVLFPEASFGAALNCVGIAQALLELGAMPVFICHQGFTGVFAEYGFQEYPLPQKTSRQEVSETYWQQFTNTHIPHFNLAPIDQLPTYVAPTWDSIVDTVEDAEIGLQILIKRIKPDLILLDNVIMFPAIANAECPWVRVISCAETELPDNNVPPYLSGITASSEQRKAFEKAYLKHTSKIHKRYNSLRKSNGISQLKPGVFLEPSPYLNLLLAPSIVRYERAAELDNEQYVFLEGCVRKDSHFSMPVFPNNTGPLVYVSFGSLGASDTDLMNRMIATFADIPARFLINAGGFLDSYKEIPDNVYLGSWFPQPSVVAQSDLFIHHGGNNSFCEALYYGIPSLIMPYCWDGHDNAQRAEATGVGRYLNRSDWTPEQLAKEIQGLLVNDSMQKALADNAVLMQQQSGTQQAAQSCIDAIKRFNGARG
ncbi:nucleotide disphospho-sugar-binding domain-containing protein [Amphritea sp.]|uniref:nucleotide disphospho-sugar-binding domain-containing protein n=1 Tax=Amphritea sp. TaxID=1872502 RepID=UPI003D106E35